MTQLESLETLETTRMDFLFNLRGRSREYDTIMLAAKREVEALDAPHTLRTRLRRAFEGLAILALRKYRVPSEGNYCAPGVGTIDFTFASWQTAKLAVPGASEAILDRVRQACERMEILGCQLDSDPFIFQRLREAQG